MRGRVHKPGLLAVICIRRAICLRSDSGYPNKKLGAWDFLPPASFFTFFLSGPSLSVTRMSLETNYKKNHQKRSSFTRCNFIVTASHFPLPLVSVEHAEKQMTSMRFKTKKKQTVKKTKQKQKGRWHSLKPAKCPWHSSGPPSLHRSVVTKQTCVSCNRGEMQGENTHACMCACVFTAE